MNYEKYLMILIDWSISGEMNNKLFYNWCYHDPNKKLIYLTDFRNQNSEMYRLRNHLLSLGLKKFKLQKHGKKSPCGRSGFVNISVKFKN